MIINKFGKIIVTRTDDGEPHIEIWDFDCDLEGGSLNDLTIYAASFLRKAADKVEKEAEICEASLQ